VHSALERHCAEKDGDEPGQADHGEYAEPVKVLVHPRELLLYQVLVHTLLEGMGIGWRGLVGWGGRGEEEGENGTRGKGVYERHPRDIS